MTTKYKVGNIIDTPKGKIKILEYTPGKRLPNNRRIHPRVTIRFIDSGWVCKQRTSPQAILKIVVLKRCMVSDI